MRGATPQKVGELLVNVFRSTHTRHGHGSCGDFVMVVAPRGLQQEINEDVCLLTDELWLFEKEAGLNWVKAVDTLGHLEVTDDQIGVSLEISKLLWRASFLRQ